MSLRGFLKRVDAELFREYQLDVLRQDRPAEVPTVRVSAEVPVFGFSRPTPPKLSLPSIASLPETHDAVQYCRKRQLPDAALAHLYFTNTWTTWIAEMGWSYALPEDHAPRLILPWFHRNGDLLGAQARRIDAEGKSGRYVTFKRNDDAEKVYGLDRVDFHKRIYLVEGPLDSWFLPNSVAAMGSDLLHVYDHHLIGHGVVCVWDNEPRNLDVSRQLHTAIKRGLPVVIWPSHLREKDLNDMILAGHDILPLVTQHTYQGLRAELEFLRWKRLSERFSTTEK